MGWESMLGVRVVGIRELEMEDWAGEVRLISVQSFGVWYGCPPQRPTANKLRSIRCAGELVFSDGDPQLTHLIPTMGPTA